MSFDYFAYAVGQAKIQAEKLGVSASIPSAPGAELGAGRGGERAIDSPFIELPNAQVQTCGLTKGRDAEIGNGGEGHSLSPLDRISCGGEVAHPSLERSVMPISPMAGSDRPTVRCGGEIRDLNTPAGMIHDGGTIERLIADVEKVQG